MNKHVCSGKEYEEEEEGTWKIDWIGLGIRWEMDGLKN